MLKHLYSVSLFIIFSISLLPFNTHAIDKPEFKANSVVSSANYEKKLISSALITIFGKNLSGTGETCTASGTDYPTTLCGTDVIFTPGGTAKLLYVSPTQINILTPNFGGKRTSITIKYPGGSVASDERKISTTSTPSIFTIDGGTKGFARATLEDGNAITALNPAKPLDKVTFLVTGLNARNRDVLLKGRFFVDGTKKSVRTKGVFLTADKVTNIGPGLDSITIEIPVLIAGGEYKITVGEKVRRGLSNPPNFVIDRPNTAIRLPLATSQPG